MVDPAIICVGTAVLDQIYAVDALPQQPSKVFATAFREAGGGPAANAAVTVARLGGRASFWGRVGGDAIGQRIVADLAREGVDVTAVEREETVDSAISAVLVDRQGERLIVNFTDPGLFRAPPQWPLERVREAGAVLGDLRWPEGAAAAFRAAREAGVAAILDADLTRGEIDRRPFEWASHVLFSREFLARFSGLEAIEAGLQRAAGELGDVWLGVTAGDEGVYWLEGAGLRHHPGFAVPVVDTLAAGDVFHGAFAMGMAGGLALSESIEWAAGAAALKCTRFGGRDGIPLRSELDEFLNERRRLRSP